MSGTVLLGDLPLVLALDELLELVLLLGLLGAEVGLLDDHWLAVPLLPADVVILEVVLDWVLGYHSDLHYCPFHTLHLA